MPESPAGRKVADLTVGELQGLVREAVDERLRGMQGPGAGVAPVPLQGEILPALVHFSTVALL